MIFLLQDLLSGKGSSTQLSLRRLAPGTFITRRANLSDFSGIVVHPGWVFRTRGDGAPHSSLVRPSLPPIGSSNAHRSLQHHSTITPAPLCKHCTTSTPAYHVPYQPKLALPPTRRSGKLRTYSNRSTPLLPAHPLSTNSNRKLLARESLDATNIIDPDDDKLYFFRGNYNAGSMTGTWPGGSILRVPGSIQRGNLKAASFARAVG